MTLPTRLKIGGNPQAGRRVLPPIGGFAGGGAPTIVVAANDSTVYSKRRADFIGDGTNDDLTIQATVDALPANSDYTLVVCEGTYDVQAVVNLGSGRVVVRGPGIMSCGSNALFTHTGSQLIVSDLSVTGGATELEMITSNTDIDALFVVRDCIFYSITAQAVIRPYHAGAAGALSILISGCSFRDITISGGGGASPNGVIWSDDSSAGDRQGALTGCTFENITGAIVDWGGNVQAERDAFLCFGNRLDNATGKREGTWFHNHLEGVYVAGDHTGVDHGSLDGLADVADHAYAFLHDGSRAMTGVLDAGDNNIINVGEIDLDLIRADAANGSITVELDAAAGADLLVGNNSALVVEGDNDRVGIGIVAPAAKLHTAQTSTTAAVPVVTLDQADVDEDYFKFIGTSDTNVDRALVDAVDFTTPGTIQGWLKINIQDDQATNPITDGDYYIPFYSAPLA